VFQWLTFLLRIREVPGQNLGPETGYPDWDLGGFHHSLQANAEGLKLGHDHFQILPNSSFTYHPYFDAI
jgi:hypothetical protein